VTCLYCLPVALPLTVNLGMDCLTHCLWVPLLEGIQVHLAAEAVPKVPLMMLTDVGNEWDERLE
jgi:hypothetical protein